MPQAHIVIGLGYGDEGKGSWVDHLVRAHGAYGVVRFNGGCQAAHHVVTEDGRTHCFNQFGSGSLVPGTKTLLSRFMLVEPLNLFREASKLERLGVHNPLANVIVSENAPIITPFNWLLNQIQEVNRGGDRHGSCGFGIGITQNDVETLGDDALYVRDFRSPEALLEKLRRLQQFRWEQARPLIGSKTFQLGNMLADVDLNLYAERYLQFAQSVSVVDEETFQHTIRTNDLVFEGAQGVMLDQRYGTFPHCTRSNCTYENAETLLREAGFSGPVERVGLLRAYATRHGHGPLVTHAQLPISACHNQSNGWQGSFRLGWFDAVSARYALSVVGGVDTLAITNLDRLNGLAKLKIATGYHNGDPRFFDERGEMLVPYGKYDLEYLRQRTDSMSEIVPHYQSYPGWVSHVGMQDYLEFLTQHLQHPIAAYSTTPTHHKTYLHPATARAHS